MPLTRRRLLAAATAAALPARAQASAPYGLKPGKPFAGAKLNILAVVTPQFQALEKRTAELTQLTGITTTWGFVPFPSLQDKVTSIGVGADDTYDVVNYLDGWGRRTPTGSSRSTRCSSKTACRWTATPKAS